MKKLKILLIIIWISQIILWIFSLLVPGLFLETAMWLSKVNPDIWYPMWMLAARFFAFGIWLFYMSKHIEKSKFWIDMMILIQIIDLFSWIFYVTTWSVEFSVAAFPMFNAIIFALLLFIFSRSKDINFKNI